MIPCRNRVRVATHESARGTWRIAFLMPSARMTPLVRQFNAYAEHHTQFVRRRELPNSAAVLGFNLGPELRVEHPLKTRTSFATGNGFYSGPSHSYVVTETDGAQTGAMVMLTLPGARRLPDRPLGDVGDRLSDPADVLGPETAREITGRLMEARSDAHRLAILEQALARRFADGKAAPGELEWAWQRLQASAGGVQISALARELGCAQAPDGAVSP